MVKSSNKWKVCTIKDLSSQIVSGFACNRKNQKPGGYVHLRTNNINPEGFLDLSHIIEIDEKKVDFKKGFLKKGNILFNNTNSKELVGKSCYIENDYEYAFSNHLTRISLKDSVDGKYVTFYLNYLFNNNYFERVCNKWIGQAGVNTTQLKQIQIPLPPLEEQQRIVARLDALFARIDKSIALLEATIAQTENLMASVLNEVFEKKLKRYKKLAIKEITNNIQYGLSGKLSKHGQFPVLRMGNLQKGRVILDNLKYIDLPIEEAQKYILRKYDILFNRTNSFELVGKTSIYDSEATALFASYLIRIDVNKSIVNPYFLNFFLNSKQTQNKLKRVARRAISQANINAKKVQEIKIPIPSMKIQDDLVTYIKEVEALVEKTSGEQQAKLANLNALKASLLDSAFRGEV
ncbi:hypothetical protein GF348_03360 [candidate division KSB3 bacterium]|nr:hypothetical protein [candidate division KSB3 bacterium]